MEIEFNPKRTVELGASQAASRPTPPTAAGESAAFNQTRALEQTLSDLPATRPDEVARAKSLIADTHYPPQELVDRIANLLALKIKG